ncbi:MAG: hypothetical protein NZM16_00075 [Thermoflexus sp.]|uniref:RHS repeat domain-containing protein n=1 Tax=Thermoflexus sp. TaxID=1969742 RepID=UPI0025EF88DA|nr:RHS repeat-associated core domain-containing protein [Thermoflexus sp.]MCS6962436.1 hypothetical protein [Thermoflexus sp.]
MIEADYGTPDGGHWHAKNYRVAWRRVTDGLGGGWREVYAYSDDPRGRCYLFWGDDQQGCTWPDAFNGPTGGRFLGYREVSVVFQDLNGATQKQEWTRFALPEGPTNDPWPARGRIREHQVRDPGGVPLQTVVYTYGISPTVGGAHFVFLQRQDATVDGRTARVEWRYDAYGNVAAVFEHGFLDFSGDERSTHRGYAPNLNAWIVDRVAWENLYEGITENVGGPALRTQTLFYYDGAAAYTAPPVKGLLTRVDRGRGDWGWVVERAGYDAWGNLTVITDARGYTTTFGYDASAVYRVWERNALGHVARYEYYGLNESDPGSGRGPVGALKRAVDPNGAATAYSYDPFGRLRTVVRPGDTWEFPTEEWRYYDGVDRPFTDRWPLMIVRLVRGTAGRAWCSGGLGSWERRFYDGLGRPVQLHAPGPGWNCSSGGQEIVRFIRYDALGRVVEESLPYFVPQYVYATTPDGRVVTPYRAPDPAAPRVRTTYDALGRPLTVTAPDGAETRLAYVEGGVLRRDANGHQTLQCRDGLGRLAEVFAFRGTVPAPTLLAEPLTVVRYRYDAMDRLTDVRDPLGNRIRMAYDPLGRKVRMDDPTMGTWHYRYDAAGNLIAQVDGRGWAVNFYYDPLSRLRGKTYTFPVGDGSTYTPPPDPGPSGYAVGYAYDEAGHGASVGRRTRAWTAEGVERTWAYDARGRVITATLRVDGTTWTQGWAYDPMDRLVRRMDPDGEALQIAYGPHGWPVSLSGWVTYAQNAAYNAAGQRTALTLLSGGTLSRAYDPQTLQVRRIQGPGVDLAYGYDRVGNVVRITDTVRGEVWAFGYDELDRLIAMSGPVAGTWTLDPGGRWLRRTEGASVWVYEYEDESPRPPVTGTYRVYLPLVARSITARCLGEEWHRAWSGEDRGRSWRLRAVSDGTALGYDGNGNVITRTVGGVEWRYVYDPENRLKEVWRGAERAAAFRYDADGGRVERLVDGVRTVVVDEGYEVRSGGVRKVYRLGGEAVAVREGGQAWAVVGDPLGSVTAVAQGNTPVASARYLPYGALRFESGAFPTDRRFTGQRWEAGLGLYDYRARFYDPYLGRFLQPDPLVPEPGNPQALNRYAYVYNNPLRYVDAGGHAPVVPLLIAGALLVLRVVDYGWTAYDMYQAGRTLADPLATDEEKWVAGLSVALSLGLEAAEAEDWLPVALPLDDLVRRAITLQSKNDPQALKAFVREIREKMGGAAPQVIRHLYDRGLFRGIRKAGEWESILEGVRGAAGLDVHHRIERRFADKLELDADDIPAVVLDRAYHQHEVTARLLSILPTGQGYTLQEVWDAYKKVYGKDLKRRDWLKAIWPYFKAKGVRP